MERRAPTEPEGPPVTIDFDGWDDEEGDEYDGFLDTGGTEEELATALGMDIS